MKKLIFFGGSKGVGKSSLAKEVSKNLDLIYLNTGERFRKYRPNFQKEFIKELVESEGRYLIDTHYAVSSSRTPYNLSIGIDERYLMHLRFNSKYDGVIYLITADPEIILERRKQDRDPRRCLELSQISKENNLNDVYSKIYASCLNLPRSIFNNENLSLTDSIEKMTNELKKWG